MRKQSVLHLSAIAVAVSTLLGASGAHAGPYRYDDGFATGNSGVWDPQSETLASFGTTLSLDFNFDFFGGTATSVQVNNGGTLEFKNGGTTLGLVTIADTIADSAAFGRAAGSATGPLPALDGDAVTNGFRVSWNFTNGLLGQIGLFSLASGDSLIEFNYLTNADGVDYSSGAISLGVINPVAGTGFNLLDYLTGSQPDCLKTFGRGVIVDNPGNSTLGCTSYFTDNALKSVALPTPFDTTNGGSTADEAVADYRYLFRYSATTTPPPPPTTVPEPATLALLTAGLAALAAVRRRRDA